jgi:hypothetical protein
VKPLPSHRPLCSIATETHSRCPVPRTSAGSIAADISSQFQSYTVYVAATIHVRIAAQRGAGSEAARLLYTCLEALNENAATNPGVGKMYAVISALMARLGVTLPGTTESAHAESE